jgi:hypothetical protein
MKCALILLLCVGFVGCTRTKAQHAKQIQRIVQDCGGESELLKESKEFFARCRTVALHMPGRGDSDPVLANLPCIHSLGDVFFYQPGHVRIRVHNSHFDTFFIYVLDPDQQPPANFERIIGNVGFIKPPPDIIETTPIPTSSNQSLQLTADRRVTTLKFHERVFDVTNLGFSQR